jgi:uncharacterized protein
MDFKKMMTRVIEQQRQSVVAMVRQMAARNGAPGASPDELAAFQSRVMDAMWAKMKPADLAKDVAGIYSEVFTADELRALGKFYGTPAGIALVEKQPEIQQRMMQVMMPRLMGAMPKVQQMAQEFAREQAAKAQAQPGGTPGAVPPPRLPPRRRRIEVPARLRGSARRSPPHAARARRRRWRPR